MFKNIPQTRMVLYLLALGSLPVLLAIANFMSEESSISELELQLLRTQQMAEMRERKQSLNLKLRAHFQKADHFYIDKNLETLTFLEPEVETLQKLVNNKYFAGDESVKKRLEFLTTPTNTLLFSEGNVQAYPLFQETTASLVHPVEINLQDLLKVLALVEGESLGAYKSGDGRPQLIVLDFKLDKKEATENNEVFLLNMKLLKREFL